MGSSATEILFVICWWWHFTYICILLRVSPVLAKKKKSAINLSQCWRVVCRFWFAYFYKLSRSMWTMNHKKKRQRSPGLSDLSGTLLALKSSFLTITCWVSTVRWPGIGNIEVNGLQSTAYINIKTLMHMMVYRAVSAGILGRAGSSACLYLPSSSLTFTCAWLWVHFSCDAKLQYLAGRDCKGWKR